MDDVYWAKIERLQRKAFTGHGFSEQEQADVRKAYEADPERYKEQHRAVARSERQRLMGLQDEEK